MGFLDDLKRQADAVKSRQQTDSAALARNTQLADAACKTVSSYFTTLAPQLNVLQPRSAGRFLLDRQHSFNGLPLTGFRADARRKRLRDEEVFDHVVLHWQMQSGLRVELAKDFLPEIERTESRLRQSGAEIDTETVRNPANGNLQQMRYRFQADFVGYVRVTPDHDQARLRFLLVNIDGFESVTADFAAFDVGSAKLDELARWLVGQPHQFLSGGIDVKRVEA